MMQDSDSAAVQQAAVVVLTSDSVCERLTNEMLQLVNQVLPMLDSDVRQAAVIVLACKSICGQLTENVLVEHVLQPLVPILQHADQDMRWAAVNVLASKAIRDRLILQEAIRVLQPVMPMSQNIESMQMSFQCNRGS